MMEHDAELSLVDLGYLMMAISDNAATDVIIARLGLEWINATLRGLGLERTVVASDCAGIGQAIMDAVGASNPDDLPPLEDPEVRRRLLACPALDLRAATQQFRHARMAGAFPFPPWVGAKSASLPPDVVNEAGVVNYLDGRRFAVAVFTRGRPVGQPPPAGQPSKHRRPVDRHRSLVTPPPDHIPLSRRAQRIEAPRPTGRYGGTPQRLSACRSGPATTAKLSDAVVVVRPVADHGRLPRVR